VATARLVDELWGERPPQTAVKSVQVFVSQLRKALGDGVLETRGAGYRLRVEPGTLDEQRFERLLDQGRQLLAGGDARRAAELLRQALALWRGPALADFEYEPFARNEIARLDELRLAALEQRLEADLALGRHAEVVGELQGLVNDHPLRETLRGLLMLALYRSGRQADALAAYQQGRAALVDELGLDPSPALQQLEKAILVQDPALELLAAASPLPSAVAAPTRPTARVPAKGAAEGRKTVTLLFCDVVSYTELGERLDPESLRLVMSLYFEQAAAVLQHHGGTVEKFIGDEVMAVFGVPVVREDDALRAVRAAVDLRDCAAAFETPVDPELRLQVRIGVNTGEVVAGDSTAGQGFVTGDAVNVGKRLEATAAPDEILLGEGTHVLVAHAVEASALEPLTLKGKRDPLVAYRLASVHPDATAIPRRDDAPFVGRAPELERLRSLYTAVAEGRGARQVVVAGEPGIGKSRLAREFLREFAGEATVLIGRCPPYGEGITFWPLREVFRQAGRDDGELVGASHDVFAAGRRLLEELARERPVVAVFDDVHWAEPTFLDFIEYLAARLGQAHVLLVCLTRSELIAARPAWFHEPAEAILLAPLSDAESSALLAEFGVPAADRRRIAEAAEGNPLFVEQLSAIADQVDTLPGSIRGVLHERLDRLDEHERPVLERAAVIGRSFSLADVLDLTPPGEREHVHAHLLQLVRARLLRPDPSGEEGFRFHHALIRDAAYDSIPKATRAELHERTAARLEKRGAADALLGYHLEHAFRFRHELGLPAAELGTMAGRRLCAAGEDAFRRTDLPACIALFERARELLPPDEVARLLPRLGQALFEAGRLAEAESVLRDAIEQAGSDSVLESRALVEEQFVRVQSATRGLLADAKSVATAALRVLARHGDELGQCRASCLQAWIEWLEGHAAAADDAWLHAATHAQAAGEEREVFEILGWRASAALLGPTPVPEAIRTCIEIRSTVEASEVAVALTLHPLAALRGMQGEFDEARALIREGNAILAELGRLQSAVSHPEAQVEMLAEEPAQAEAALRAGYDRLEQMGEKSILSTTAALLARAIYAQGRYADADRFCSVSENAAAAEDLSAQVTWRGVRAKILARDGNTDEAETLARESVRLAAQTDMLNRRADALLDLAEVLQLAENEAGANDALHEALELYERKENAVSAGHARSLIGAGRPERTYDRGGT
jgi:class 3 adenylate cyclase/predicted ATPase